jgi:hypothetical protein
LKIEGDLMRENSPNFAGGKSTGVLKLAAWCVLVLFALTGPIRAQEKSPEDPQSACKSFVQRFYDQWTTSKTDVSFPDHILKYKHSIFSPELLGLFKEWSEAQAKDPGDEVGPGFDIFLNSQDPADKYIVEKVTIKADQCRADIYGITEGKKSASPDVVADVVVKDGAWSFVNFHYDYGDGKKGDLLSLLKEDRKEWGKSSK